MSKSKVWSTIHWMGFIVCAVAMVHLTNLALSIYVPYPIHIERKVYVKYLFCSHEANNIADCEVIPVGEQYDDEK